MACIGYTALALVAAAAGGSADVWKLDGPTDVTSALEVLRITKEGNFSEIKKILVVKLVGEDSILAVDGVQIIDEFKF